MVVVVVVEVELVDAPERLDGSRLASVVVVFAGWVDVVELTNGTSDCDCDDELVVFEVAATTVMDCDTAAEEYTSLPL